MDIAQLNRVQSVQFICGDQNVTMKLRLNEVCNNFRRQNCETAVERRKEASLHLLQQYYSLDHAAMPVQNERTVEEFLIKLCLRTFKGVSLEQIHIEKGETSCTAQVTVKDLQKVLLVVLSHEQLDAS